MSHMRIRTVKAIYPRWNRPLSDAWQSHFWQIVVMVTTECGRTGYGYGGGGGPAVQVVNSHLSRFLTGRTLEGVDDIRAAWQALYRASLPYGRGGIAMMALSGVDLALWDLLGRARNQPVCELLGGGRVPSVRAYASGLAFETYRDMGFEAVKVFCHWREPADYDRTEALIARAREVMGTEALVMLDCYMSWNAEIAVEMRKRLAPYNVYWFEDILTPDHKRELTELKPQLAPVLSAGGEHEFTLEGYKALAAANSLDIWQPDVTWCGGLTGALAILELADKAGIPVCLHRGGEPWGLHLISASNCLDLAELVGPDRRDGTVQAWKELPRLATGRLHVADRPGFGVEPDPALLA
jgi:L-rhamnonate dehydratase